MHSGVYTRQGIVLSCSMIGRMLDYLRQRHLLIDLQPTRATPRARNARLDARRKPAGVTIPRDRPGNLVQIDTMRLALLPGVVRYHFSAVDVVSRFGVAEVRARCPFTITAIQIDGGSEFKTEFEQECADQEMRVWVLPPHRSKLNGSVERMNRTFRDEWQESYEGEVDVASLREAGWAGEEMSKVIRPHQSLGMRTLIAFLAERFGIHA